MATNSSPDASEDWLVEGPATADAIVLAHGAGQGMDSPFMNFFAEGLAARGHRVVRFEFPYMRRRRTEGTRSPPDRMPKLIEAWQDVIAALAPDRVIIGGKSMGGRIASHVTDHESVRGLVCLGYPFHPAGKPDRLRIDHLRDVAVPALVLQGERDPMGRRGEVESFDLPARWNVHWLPDGDHSFVPRKKSGVTQQQNWEQAVAAVADFAAGLA